MLLSVIDITTEIGLFDLASEIGSEWFSVGINLQLSSIELEHIQEDNRGNIKRTIFEMLRRWRDRSLLNNQDYAAMRHNLVNALTKESRGDLVMLLKPA